MKSHRRRRREQRIANACRRFVWWQTARAERAMNAHMLKAGYPEGIGSKYFWRDGRPMPFRWYMRKVEDAAYKVVAKSYPTEAIEVSTVWLGLDHGFSFHSKGPQQIFESMVFGGPMHNEQWRYSTEDEARRGHVELLDKVITALSEVSA